MEKIIKHYPMTDRLIVRQGYMLSSISFAEITLAFEDDGPSAHHH
jgi:hypothetical protein